MGTVTVSYVTVDGWGFDPPIPSVTDEGWGGWITHTIRYGWRMGGIHTQQFELLNAVYVYVDMDEEVNGSALYKYV
jgi:hypothetical protein